MIPSHCPWWRNHRSPGLKPLVEISAPGAAPFERPGRLPAVAHRVSLPEERHVGRPGATARRRGECARSRSLERLSLAVPATDLQFSPTVPLLLLSPMTKGARLVNDPDECGGRECFGPYPSLGGQKARAFSMSIRRRNSSRYEGLSAQRGDLWSASKFERSASPRPLPVPQRPSTGSIWLSYHMGIRFRPRI